MINAMIAKTTATMMRVFRMTEELPRDPSSMLGERVFVTVDRGDAKHLPVITKGKLLAWSATGEAIIEEANGDIVHCWPMLKITREDAATQLTDTEGTG